MAAAVAEAVLGVAGTEAGREHLAVGAGGDRTAVVDRRAEDAVLAVGEAAQREGMRFLLRSEELGERAFGARSPMLLLDPVDGSLNAMFGVPYFCTSLALLDGDRIGDGAAAVVRSLSGPQTFTAVRGGGAWCDGRPLAPLSVGLTADGRVPMLLLEAIHGAGRAGMLADLLGNARRVRILGAAALSLCQAATGAASAVVAPGLRSFDCAAAHLVLREAGAVVTDLEGRSLDGVVADLAGRVPVVASLDEAVHHRVLELCRP